MIKRLNIETIEEIAEYVWAVYQDESKRTTPPYGTLKDVKTHLLKQSKYESCHFLAVIICMYLMGLY